MNQFYPRYKAALRRGDVDESAVTFNAVLVDLDTYTFDATHEFLSSIPAGARVATVVLTNPSVSNTAVFDADDLTFLSVAAGPAVEALVIYVDTGSAATSRLQSFIDTATGLPVTPNGGNIPVTWNASGINQL